MGEDVAKFHRARGESKQGLCVSAPRWRAAGWLVWLFFALGVGACGGEVEPDDGPQRPASDGHPGTPADDAAPDTGALDGGITGDASRAR